MTAALDTPLMMVDNTGRRHAFFITMDGGKYVARGPDQPSGNRSFISPRMETNEEAVAYASRAILREG